MKEYAHALRKLHSSIDLSSDVDSILKLSAIEVFCQALDEQLKAPESHEKAEYVREKVELFRSYCHYAILPVFEMNHKSPHDWLKAAEFNLLKVESEIA